MCTYYEGYNNHAFKVESLSHNISGITYKNGIMIMMYSDDNGFCFKHTKLDDTERPAHAKIYRNKYLIGEINITGPAPTTYKDITEYRCELSDELKKEIFEELGIGFMWRELQHNWDAIHCETPYDIEDVWETMRRSHCGISKRYVLSGKMYGDDEPGVEAELEPPPRTTYDDGTIVVMNYEASILKNIWLWLKYCKLPLYNRELSDKKSIEHTGMTNVDIYILKIDINPLWRIVLHICNIIYNIMHKNKGEICDR